MIDSHFLLPVQMRCRICERDEMLFDDTTVPDRTNSVDRGTPLEAYRCRMCYRGLFEVVAGISRSGLSREADAVEVVARCQRCHHQALIASSSKQDAQQQVRLDLLYGRR